MQPTSNEAKERMQEALSIFKNALPNGVPQEVLDALEVSIKIDGGTLPSQLFYEIVEQLAVAISIADVHGNILYCNPTFEKLTGYASIELIGQQHSLLSYKKTPIEVYKSLWHHVTNGQKWNGTLLNRCKDGSPYLANLTVAPVFNSKGEICYFLGIHRDVSEQMELERKLVNQKNLLETIIDDAPIVICLVDDDQHVVVENHGYKVLSADLKGEEPARYILSAITTILGSDFEELKRLRRSFDNVEIRVEFGNFQTPRWYSCSGTWIENFKIDADSYFDEEPSSGLLLIFNDISKRRFLFEQAKTNAIKALMAEKQMVQGMHEVLSGSIYQLQGPLNMVAAASAMLDRGVCDPLTLRAALNEVKKSGEEALAKLRTCLPDVRPEAIQPININELIREVLDISTEKFLSAGVMMSWRPLPVVPSILGQAHALRSMIKHLLDNAILAINEPGATGREISIDTQVVDNGVVEFVISDTGAGICDEDRHKVFEPFYTKWVRAKGHSGMGLAIVQQVLSEHNASVEISKSFGGGTQVRVSLPFGEY